MRNYFNILDFFLDVREQNLCTTPFCSTCGAMEFRSLCKELGKDKVKELLEATTMEDLLKVHPDLWFDPFKIMLIDGFQCDTGCPIMLQYEKGYEFLVLGNTRDLVYEKESFQVYAVTGNIFEEQTTDVLALFQNPGMVDFPVKVNRFFKDNDLSIAQNVLIPCSGKHGNVKAVYYVNTAKTHGVFREVSNILYAFLDAVSAAGLSSIAMNGIRTLGDSESDNLQIIKEWFMVHLDTSIKTLLLIDKRAGFRRLRTF